MSDLTLIRDGHTEVADGQCGLCDTAWPCDTGVVLAALAAAEASAEQAEQRYQRARAETFDCYTETLRERNANAALRERLATVEAALRGVRNYTRGTDGLPCWCVERAETHGAPCLNARAALAATPAAGEVTT